jgi:hypothetical protein
MFERIARSWDLIEASAAVVRADKELLLFPVLSAVSGLLVAASFLVPALMDQWLPQAANAQDPLLFVWVFAFYLCGYFVTFFFNSALVGAALIRLEGGDPTLGDGLAIAWRNAGRILGYAMVAATVGLLLKAIERRVGFVGQIVVGLLGAAWTVATFLAVPVLVARNVGPLDAVKESASLLRKTWGENLAGNIGMGLVFGIAYIVLALAIFPIAVIGSRELGPAVFFGMLAAFVILALTLATFHATLQGVYSAALYRYATTGQPGFGFDAERVKAAFVPRGGPTIR